MLAEVANVPVFTTVAGIENEVDAPTASAPTVHVTVPPAAEQPAGNVPRVIPEGGASVSVEPLEPIGPVFETCAAKV